MNGLEAAVAPALTWLAAHPAWAGFAIGLIALAESLAIVGLLVPGAVLMFMAGAAVGGSQLEIVPMLAWAIGGAVVGDGLSYWLGRHYRDQLRDLPVIRRYPGALQRAEALFQRHGGKSVVIGRFVGPVRPVIPAVVGMLGMPPGRFLFANISSALVWGPAYLLPGVVFGASLLLAVEVVGRLMAWLVVLFGGFFLLRGLLRWIDRPLRLAGSRLARSLGRRPPASRWRALWQPVHAALRALRYRRGWLWWSGLLVTLATGFAATQPWLPLGWEQGWVAFADAQRSPWLQTLAWRVTQLGGGLPITLATLSLAAILWRAQQTQRAGLVLLGVGLSLALAYGLKPLVALPRPNDLTQLAAFSAAFPSAHATGIAALVTAWVCCWPAWPYRRAQAAKLGLALGIALVVGVSGSRVVLGVHWPLDTLAGAGLGVVLGALPALAGRAGAKRVDGPVKNARPVVASMLVLLLGAGLTQAWQWPDPRSNYPERAVIEQWPSVTQGLAPSAWADQRLSLTGPRDDIAAYWLAGIERPAGFAQRWQAPLPWRWQTALRWVSPQPSPARLPVLPRFHQGRLPAVVWVQIDAAQRSRWVLRAWQQAQAPQASAWVLSLEHERIRGGVLLPRFARRHATAAEVNALLSGPAARAQLQTNAQRVPLFAPRRD